MTPFEYGRFVKLAVETGGFGEYLGQGFDRGVQGLTSALGLGKGIDPGAFTGRQKNNAAGVDPVPPPGGGFSQPRTADPVWPAAPPAGGGFSQPQGVPLPDPPAPPPGGGFSQPAPAVPPADPGYTSTAELERRKRQEQLDRMAAGARMAAPQYQAPKPAAPKPANPAYTSTADLTRQRQQQAAPKPAPRPAPVAPKPAPAPQTASSNPYGVNLWGNVPANKPAQQPATTTRSLSDSSTETREGGITTSRNGQPVALTPEQQRRVDGIRKIRQRQEEALR